MKKQLAGYVCLAMALVMLLGGIHVSHEAEIGLVGIAVSLGLLVVAFRALKAPG
jgi:hypothetical protein